MSSPLLRTSTAAKNATSLVATAADYTATRETALMFTLLMYGLTASDTILDFVVKLTRTIGGGPKTFIVQYQQGIGKYAATDTLLGWTSEVVGVQTGDIVNVYVLSSNAGDTAVGCTLDIYDCYSADAIVTTLPTIGTDWLTGDGLAASATAEIAAAVWKDATAGDFTTASSIGKSLYTSGAVPGAASGLALVGSEMGLANDAITAAKIAANAIGASELATDAVSEISAAVNTALVVGGGSGTNAYTVTVNDGSNPIPNVNCFLTSDSAGTTVLYQAYTNALGVATFAVNTGTYYLWVEAAGYTATNPTTVVIT